jgi:hypothetical protein
MNNIIIGFSKPKKWKLFAWLIMKGYNIPYDHVYIRFHSDKYDRDLIYQASGTKVNFTSPIVFSDDNDIIKEFSIETDDENKTKVMQFAIDNAGKPYGIKEAFGLALVRILDIVNITIKNPFADGEFTYVCSEMGWLILEKLRSNIKIDKDPDDITPLDLYNILSNLS